MEATEKKAERIALLKKLILCALPIVATSVLQQLFNTADMAVVGRFVGDSAYAAIGSTGTIVSLFVEFFLGFSVGANVVIAYEIGKRNEKKIHQSVHTAIAFSLCFGVLIGVIGVILARLVLIWTLVPDELLDQASLYLRIYFAGMPVYMLFNICAAIFRASGETRVPFVCLTIGGVLNVGLNLIFVLVFHLGVAGVATATVAANCLSAALLLWKLKKRQDALKIRFRDMKIQGKTLLRILKIGVPSAFLGSMFSISNLCVQSAVNSLGPLVISASTAASGVEIYVQYFGSAFAQTATTFVSQNYGAGDLKNCKKVAKYLFCIGFGTSIVLSFTAYAFGNTLVRIFTADDEIVKIAIQRMQYTMLFKGVQFIMDLIVGCLQGYGRTFVPALISVIMVCGFRLVWVYTYFAAHSTLSGLMVVYPITWCLAVISHGIYYIWTVKSLQKKAENVL